MSANDCKNRGDDRARAGPTILIGAGLAAVTLAVSTPALGSWCTFTSDSFGYLETARRLFETGTFPPERLMRPGGFPTLIAPLLVFGDMPLLALRVMFSLGWAAASMLTFVLFRRELGDRLAAACGLLVATSPLFYVQSTVLLSEPVFTPLLLGALALASRWRRLDAVRWTEIVLGGVLAGAASLVRTVGIVAIPIMAWTLLRNRRVRPARARVAAAGFVLAAAIPLAVWQVRQSRFTSGQTYRDIWTTARTAEHTERTGLALQAERLATFGPQRLRDVKAALLPQAVGWRAFAPPFDLPLTLLVGGGVACLVAVRCVRVGTPADYVTLATLAVLAFWPWSEGERMIAPLAPILIGHVVWATRGLLRRATRPPVRRAGLATVLCVWLAAQFGDLWVTAGRLDRHESRFRERLADMAAVAQWLRTTVPDGEPWTGVTLDGDEGKLVLLGASYLSRRPVQTVDVDPAGQAAMETPASRWSLVQDAAMGPAGFSAADKSSARILSFHVLGPMADAGISRPDL